MSSETNTVQEQQPGCQDWCIIAKNGLCVEGEGHNHVLETYNRLIEQGIDPVEAQDLTDAFQRGEKSPEEIFGAAQPEQTTAQTEKSSFEELSFKKPDPERLSQIQLEKEQRRSEISSKELLGVNTSGKLVKNTKTGEFDLVTEHGGILEKWDDSKEDEPGSMSRDEFATKIQDLVANHHTTLQSFDAEGNLISEVYIELDIETGAVTTYFLQEHQDDKGEEEVRDQNPIVEFSVDNQKPDIASPALREIFGSLNTQLKQVEQAPAIALKETERKIDLSKPVTEQTSTNSKKIIKETGIGIFFEDISATETEQAIDTQDIGAEKIAADVMAPKEIKLKTPAIDQETRIFQASEIVDAENITRQQETSIVAQEVKTLKQTTEKIRTVKTEKPQTQKSTKEKKPDFSLEGITLTIEATGQAIAEPESQTLDHTAVAAAISAKPIAREKTISGISLQETKIQGTEPVIPQPDAPSLEINEREETVTALHHQEPKPLQRQGIWVSETNTSIVQAPGILSAEKPAIPNNQPKETIQTQTVERPSLDTTTAETESGITSKDDVEVQRTGVELTEKGIRQADQAEKPSFKETTKDGIQTLTNQRTTDPKLFFARQKEQLTKDVQSGITQIRRIQELRRAYEQLTGNNALRYSPPQNDAANLPTALIQELEQIAA